MDSHARILDGPRFSDDRLVALLEVTIRTTLLLSAIALGLAACVADTRPDDAACSAPTIELELTVRADDMVPSDPSVCRDQEVTLVISAQVDGVIHLHGYDAELPATELSNGDELSLIFDASRSGQYPIELHRMDSPQGINVGILTVHEP